jgi:hypothetical protein
MRYKPNLLAAIEGTPLGRHTTIRSVIGTVAIVVFVLERQEDVTLLAAVVLSSSVRVDVNDDATFGGRPLVGVLVDDRQQLEILRVLGLRPASSWQTPSSLHGRRGDAPPPGARGTHPFLVKRLEQVLHRVMRLFFLTAVLTLWTPPPPYVPPGPLPPLNQT